MLPQLSLSRSLFSLARRLEFELLFVSATGALLFIIINLEVRRKARRVRDEGCVFVFRSSEPQRFRIDRFDRPRPSLSQLGLLRLPLFFSLTSLSPASPPLFLSRRPRLPNSSASEPRASSEEMRPLRARAVTLAPPSRFVAAAASAVLPQQHKRRRRVLLRRCDLPQGTPTPWLVDVANTCRLTDLDVPSLELFSSEEGEGEEEEAAEAAVEGRGGGGGGGRDGKRHGETRKAAKENDSVVLVRLSISPTLGGSRGGGRAGSSGYFLEGEVRTERGVVLACSGCGAPAAPPSASGEGGGGAEGDEGTEGEGGEGEEAQGGPTGASSRPRQLRGTMRLFLSADPDDADDFDAPPRRAEKKKTKKKVKQEEEAREEGAGCEEGGAPGGPSPERERRRRGRREERKGEGGGAAGRGSRPRGPTSSSDASVIFWSPASSSVDLTDAAAAALAVSLPASPCCVACAERAAAARGEGGGGGGGGSGGRAKGLNWSASGEVSGSGSVGERREGAAVAAKSALAAALRAKLGL